MLPRAAENRLKRRLPFVVALLGPPDPSCLERCPALREGGCSKQRRVHRRIGAHDSAMLRLHVPSIP
eukprot:3445234-Alexandrium_andersonii.AAC.1